MKLQKLKNDCVVIIDGMNLFHRVYYKFFYLTTKTGYPTGAVFGFFNSLINIMNLCDSNRFIICWESKSVNWKRDENKNYKSNRDNRFTPEEQEAFHICLNDIFFLCGAVGILQTQVSKYEADDIIFYLTDQIKKNVVIVSKDKDMLQLVNDKRNIKCLRSGSSDKGGYDVVDEKAVKELFHGLTPKQVPLYLAIAGDTGDCVKGVKGMGDKKATQIINKYKTITSENVKLIFKPNEKKQFIDSLKLVRASSIIKRIESLNASDFRGIKPFDKEKVENMLNDFGIKKFNTSVLKQLHNYSFKTRLLNKIIGADYES